MTTQRQLNLNDVGAAWRLSTDEAARVAAPLIDELRDLAMPGGCDPAGIPYRGTLVFRELMEGRPLAELRAAYATLRRLNCQSGVIDALETAYGEADD
jgi:hypothetical protein